MRLAVVSPFIDRRHGTERALAEQLERLARDHGCEVHLYAQHVRDLALASPQAAPAARGGIFWHKVPAIPGPHLLQFLAWMFFNGFLRKWHSMARGVSCDVLLSPGINCLRPDAVVVHALFHRLRQLSVAEPGPDAPRTGWLRRLHRSLYYRVLARLERRIYCDPRVSLAAVSPRIAALLQQYFQRPDVRVIPNAVDTSVFCPAARLAKRAEARRRCGFRDEEFVLLLIGNDWNTKGLPTILESLAALPNFPLRLLVVGDDATAPFESLASRLGVKDRCLWESAHCEVLDAYAAADVYVSPSREDAFGLPVVEAMACGLPAITSACAGVSEYIQDEITGFVLRDPRSAQALADLLCRLWTDASLRTRVSQAAANAACQWTWDKNAEALSGFLADRLRSAPQ